MLILSSQIVIMFKFDIVRKFIPRLNIYVKVINNHFLGVKIYIKNKIKNL